MARWEPDSRGRLEQAAIALFGEQGFDATTVGEIAARAGVTERTFFRHYGDKREVLFAGAGEFQAAILEALADAPASLQPIDAAAAGLEAAGQFLDPRREFARQRQAVIAANPELRERELGKFASLSAGIADKLRARGLSDPAATLTADIAMTVFRIAFERWLDADGKREFPHLVRDSLADVKAVTAAA